MNTVMTNGVIRMPAPAHVRPQCCISRQQLTARLVAVRAADTLSLGLTSIQDLRTLFHAIRSLSPAECALVYEWTGIDTSLADDWSKTLDHQHKLLKTLLDKSLLATTLEEAQRA